MNGDTMREKSSERSNGAPSTAYPVMSKRLGVWAETADARTAQTAATTSSRKMLHTMHAPLILIFNGSDGNNIAFFHYIAMD
jgi:hypothetical protein